MIPKTQRAIVGQSNGSLTIATDVELPTIEPDMLLVRNMAVALNPIDSKMTGKLVTPGAIAGMDFAGVVVAIGSAVRTPVPIKIGDRVCGAVQGMHSLTPRVGAFTEYVGASDIVTLKIPDHMSFEEGASLGSSVGTIGLALCRSLELPGTPSLPASTPRIVMVYGGSSATGTLAIQLLKLSGFRPIATCSPKNFDLVRSYGAEAVFDYRSPTCIQEIQMYTKRSLKFILDCISEPETMTFCHACMGRTGGRYTALEPFPIWLETRASIKSDWVLGPTLLGKRISWGPPFERDGDPALREFAMEWFKSVNKLLDDRKLVTHPLRIMPGGLEPIMEGMELLRKKQISGQKLIYQLAT